MIEAHPLGFRINFILGICLNVITFVTIWFWYYPVSLQSVHVRCGTSMTDDASATRSICGECNNDAEAPTT